MLVFGPVPSRRLGRSVGINNIPPKVCTYSCVYCQLGVTKKCIFERENFYIPEKIFEEAKSKIETVIANDERIDYLTFVADGEPTLDLNLGEEIRLLKKLGIKIAVITNASLLWRQDIREDLTEASWISVKVDSIREKIWRLQNCPHRRLELDKIIWGIEEFRNEFNGVFTTETMLVQNLNDNCELIEELAVFLEKLQPEISYISIPTRPPAKKNVKAPDEIIVNQAYQILRRKLNHVEYLIGYEGSAFSFTGDAVEDILSITAVHPMKKSAIIRFLEKAGTADDILAQLINEEKLKEVEYCGEKYYLRRFNGS